MADTNLKDKNEEQVPSCALKCIPWKNLKILNNDLLVKTLFSVDSYEILVADLSMGMIWFERITSAQIQQRIKTLNSAIEISVAKMLQHISDKCESGISDGATFFRILSNTDGRSSSATLKATFSVAELPLVWQFNMTSIAEKILTEHLTIPLMLMTSELMRQQHLCFSMLKAKDREIADLRAQSVQSTRKNLETKLFDESTFTKDCESSQNSSIYGRDRGITSTFSSDGQQLYVRVIDALTSQSDAQNNAMLLKPVSRTLPRGEHGGDIGRRASSSLVEVSRTSPVKIKELTCQETELQRRQELEKRIAEKEEEKGTKRKKKALKL